MKNAIWLPKRGAFLKMISIYVVCFVLSVYSKLFNCNSVRGHVAVKNIIDAKLFREIQDGCQDGRHKIFYIMVYNTPCFNRLFRFINQLLSNLTTNINKIIIFEMSQSS